MSFPIRRLEAADAERFQRLRLAALLDTPEAFGSSHDEEKDLPLPEVARRFEAPRHNVLGAFDGDELVGMVGLALDARTKFAHKGRVWGMYVPPALRGHGVAHDLMHALLRLAREQPGLARLVLVADAANVPAIALYESLGFVVFGREQDAMRVDGRSRDELHMVLPLAAPARR